VWGEPTKNGKEIFGFASPLPYLYCILSHHCVKVQHWLYWKITIMSDSSKKLALNIKKIRARKHMSQGDICRELGVDRAYISTIESGKQNPTLSTIERIAKALGVSVDELLK